MKKMTISKLKSIFGSKKGKRQQQHQSSKSSRSHSPESAGPVSPSSGESFRPLQRTPPPSRIGPPPSPPVPTHPVAPVAPEPSAPLPLSPCPVCTRTFVPASLAKHVKICEKTMAKKRKTFDSSRQRREGTDLEQYLPKNFGLPENSPFLEKSPPNTAKATPKPKAHSVRSAIMKPTADLQKCPHCNRAFGLRAFERHVEWCADKAKILPAAPAQPPPHIADAKQRLNARTQYKAPLARARRSSQSREKSSNSRSASVESSRGISPPREYGDYRHQRTRASESVSSNDCHEDSSPHIPVIRNSRVSQNNSSGDANVKARQARLARDLSSSRNTQEPHPPTPVQQSNTDPNIVKQELQTKRRNRLNAKKKQQLKKLEEIANKYNERTQKTKEETQKTKEETKKPKIQRTSIKDKKKIEKKEIPAKSQIPIPKKIKQKQKVIANDDQNSQSQILTDNIIVDIENISNINDIDACKELPQIDVKDKKVKSKTNKEDKKKTKESSISLDSLEEGSLEASKRDKNCHSIGINTELLCPCVPCVIHDTPEQRIFNPKQTKSSKKQVDKNHQSKIETVQPVVELLYKNPNMMTSSCDIESKRELEKEITSNDNISINNCIESTTDLSNTLSELKDPITKENSKVLCVELPNITSGDSNCEPEHDLLSSEVPNLSEEHIEQNYEHDLSEYSFEDSFENKNELSKETTGNDEDECRYGSGDTYTKFTENPEDLEEFLNITDKLISNTELEKCIENIHTPQTNSIESINKDVDENDNETSVTNHIFSNSLEELKNDLKDLLEVAGKDGSIANNSDGSDTETKKHVDSMEHITVYGLKIIDQEKKDPPQVLNETPSELKLPSINECNQFSLKTSHKSKISSIYEENRKCKMLGHQKRSDNDYKTFIINEDQDDVSDEAPPLKLPRIEIKRLDDNYDPFASAARQMKELMSSDTDISKKIINPSKNSSNGTLPSLRPNKDKISSNNRSENSKMIKDTINKTYQKTPTLHRMKSFGSASNENNNSSFGGRCSSFRLNRNDKKTTTKLNTTFTKSSKENISSTEKTSFTRNSNLNRSFSSYSNSSYSTPKLKDKIPKISQSMHHGFQRTTIKQPVKLDKINKDEEKKNFVTLDAILGFDNTSMTDSNYIDPRLINENDNLPINVNTILNNPDIISSMESLLTTENLPAKFESFNSTKNNNYENNITQSLSNKVEKNNNINKQVLNDFSSQYDKILSSLEQSIASKNSVRDDDSLCEDFDLEEFMTTFDEEVHKQKIDKRSCSSTTRVVTSDFSKEYRATDTKVVNSPKVVNNGSNGLIPVNKSTSLIFSSNNIVSDKVFPSSVKRSTSLLDSIHKKSGPKIDSAKSRHKTDQLEEDLMQSLKDFDKFYESEKNDNQSTHKEIGHINKNTHDTSKKETRRKTEHKTNKSASTNGNYTPNGKSSNDSAYSSLNRISPSKLSLCNAKDTNGIASLEKIPAGSDSSCSHKDDIRSISSEEFLAMERSTELDGTSLRPEQKDVAPTNNDKRSSSRASWRRPEALSSSGSECSLHKPAPRLSRFCHECGSRFLDTAKFCIECGVKRLLL